MKLALFCLIVSLGLTASARADVFVPADPPSSPADCVAAGGDVVGVGGPPLSVSVGGAAFRPLAALRGCPVVAAADDGTVAILSVEQESMELVVRRAGVFGAPIPLGELRGGELGVSAARGGWAAVAWLAHDGRAVAVMLAVARPDGSIVRTVLERVADSASPRAASLGAPRVAIGPAGSAVVVWSRSVDRASRVRMGQVAGDGSAVVRDLPGALSERYTESPLAVAVAPGGETLLAWAAEDGVRVLSGGGGSVPVPVPAVAPVLVSPGPDAAYVTAALNSAGAAIVAHGNVSGEIVVAERIPGGNWTLPRVVADTSDPSDGVGFEGREATHVAASVLAADGRAVVVWRDEPSERPRIVGASGRVGGGSWSGASALSAITREGFNPTLSLDARGEPQVFWTEPALGIRGARLAPARADVTPPRVSARLPARTRQTAAGRPGVAVRVRCSEACDARLSIRDRAVVRALPDGRTFTLRLTLPRELTQRSRRLRLVLVVTDRAGNVVRSSRVVRVAGQRRSP